MNRRLLLRVMAGATLALKTSTAYAREFPGKLTRAAMVRLRHRGWLRANISLLDGYLNRKESESEYGKYFQDLASRAQYANHPPKTRMSPQERGRLQEIRERFERDGEV